MAESGAGSSKSSRTIAKRRLFFTLWPSDALRLELATLAQPAIKAAGVNVVPPANYHITLAFLGSISASSLPGIREVARSVRFLPCEICLDRTGYWPSSQVVWLGASSIPLVLDALVDDLWNKLADLGFSKINEAYQPHVTLCRKLSRPIEIKLDRSIVWPVSSFALAESRQSVDGPSYTLLEHFPAGD